MIKIQNKTDNKIEFTSDIPISLINGIRRSVNDMPILAVDELEITKNDSALYDEIIAHRVGLVPLKNEDLRLKEECTCKGKGCGKCSVKFKLSAKGPKIVYSDEMSPKGNSINKTPITILDKDQEIEFVATAIMGLGNKHAKFSPGIIYYKYTDDTDNDEEFKKLLEEVKKDEDKELTINIESWGQIDPKDIFVKAITTLNKNLKEFVKSVK